MWPTHVTCRDEGRITELLAKPAPLPDWLDSQKHTHTHLFVGEDGLIVLDGSGGVAAGDIGSKHTARHARHPLSGRGVYGAGTNTQLCEAGRCACVFGTGVCVCVTSQDVSVRLAAGDQRQVELVLVQRDIIAVDRLARRLLQG